MPSPAAGYWPLARQFQRVLEQERHSARKSQQSVQRKLAPPVIPLRFSSICFFADLFVFEVFLQLPGVVGERYWLEYSRERPRLNLARGHAASLWIVLKTDPLTVRSHVVRSRAIVFASPRAGLARREIHDLY